MEEYLAGRTPIPCTLCNNYIKFDRFLEMADAVGARQIATGHYARIRYDAASGRYQLLRAVDHAKDQTYFLFGLTQAQLARTLFPAGRADQARGARAGPLHGPGRGRQGRQPGDLLRPQRRLRRVPDGLPARNRRRPSGRREGEIVSTDGRALGEHAGVHHFTVGQRRGLGIATGEPLYVISTDPASQRVVVGGNDDLLARALRRARRELDFHRRTGCRPARAGEDSQQARRRAGVDPRHRRSGRVEVVFDEPQRAVTPGQGAVFYDGDLVLGGGWIE